MCSRSAGLTQRGSAAVMGAQCYAGWGGLIVLPVVDGRLFIGKIRKIADPHFAVQGVGQRAVVIHELGQLEGQYAAGQLAEIKYREGRGNDLLQVTERSRKRPGPER